MAKVYSVKEAAEQLGISGQRVRQLLAEGRIKGKRLGHDWVVLDPSYTKQKRGRKPKKVAKERRYSKQHKATSSKATKPKGG